MPGVAVNCATAEAGGRVRVGRSPRSTAGDTPDSPSGSPARLVARRAASTARVLRCERVGLRRDLEMCPGVAACDRALGHTPERRNAGAVTAPASVSHCVPAPTCPGRSRAVDLRSRALSATASWPATVARAMRISLAQPTRRPGTVGRSPVRAASLRSRRQAPWRPSTRWRSRAMLRQPPAYGSFRKASPFWSFIGITSCLAPAS